MQYDFELLLMERIQALATVVHARDEDAPMSPAYIVRKMMRWYSKEFHTPLCDVEALPLEDIAQHFWESRYEEMVASDDDEAIQKNIQLLTETPEERHKRTLVADAGAADDDKFFEDTVAEVRSKAARAPKRLDEAPDPDQGPLVQLPIMGGKDLYTHIPSTAPELKKLPEGAQMKFMTDEELAEIGDWDIVGPPPKK